MLPILHPLLLLVILFIINTYNLNDSINIIVIDKERGDREQTAYLWHMSSSSSSTCRGTPLSWLPLLWPSQSGARASSSPKHSTIPTAGPSTTQTRWWWMCTMDWLRLICCKSRGSWARGRGWEWRPVYGYVMHYYGYIYKHKPQFMNPSYYYYVFMLVRPSVSDCTYTPIHRTIHLHTTFLHVPSKVKRV